MTPEPMPRRGQGRPNGCPYGPLVMLTFTVLAPTRSTAWVYAFCNSAIMGRLIASAAYVERVSAGPVTDRVVAEREEAACLGPESLERLLVLIEESGLDDPVLVDPEEKEIGLFVHPIAARPFRRRKCRRLHVARQDVDELRAECTAGQLLEFLEVREDLGVAPMVPGDETRSRNVPDRVRRNQILQRGGILRFEGRVELLHDGLIRVLEDPLPLGHGGQRALLVLKAFAHHVRSDVLEERELIPARVFEQDTRTRRNLERAAFRLPAAGPELLRGRFQIGHLEKRQARRGGTVIGQEILRALAQSEGGDLRAEGVAVSQEPPAPGACVGSPGSPRRRRTRGEGFRLSPMRPHGAG